MTKKLYCTVTGNVSYMTDKRYAKLLARYGDEKNLRSRYVSALGKKIRDGIIDQPARLKNRIQCSITGKWCYISRDRINNGITSYGSWDSFTSSYICRPAARLLCEGKTAEEIKEIVLQDEVKYHNI